MAYNVGDAVEVVVVTRRGKQPEWIPATVTALQTDPDLFDVTFAGGSRQRFPADTERVRTPQAAQEGEQWAFWTF
jgi:hypothetical protein